MLGIWLTQKAPKEAATHICDVEVDVDLGIVRVKYTSIQDVGKLSAITEGQLQGGCAQRIGWALRKSISTIKMVT